MKKIILAIALVAPLSVSADNGKASKHEMCKAYSFLSRKVMELRQAGGIAHDMIETAKGDKLAESIVLLSFEKPQYRLEENREKEAIKFSNEFYINCVK